MMRNTSSEALNGIYLASNWSHRISNEWSRKFTEKFKQRWGFIPGDFAAAKFIECQLTARMMMETGSMDPEVLIPALEQLGEFDGPTGREYMSAYNHQIVHDFLLLRGKPPEEKKYEDDYVEVIGRARVYPEQGEPGFKFDRTKESL